MSLFILSLIQSKNTSTQHLLDFYKTFSEVKNKKYDGLIITGAPVEQMEFEEVEYWQELCEIMEWSKTHVHSTFHICWGAQAGLYYHFGIKKHMLTKKLFGVYEHTLEKKTAILFRGFDDKFMVPHSPPYNGFNGRCGKAPGDKILSSSEKAGIYAAMTENGKQIFIMGHSEYDANSLENEYLRDKAAGYEIDVPENYYPDDNPKEEPVVTWRSWRKPHIFKLA